MPLILLVDDDKDFRKIYSRYLVEDGYEVLEAADGEQALRPAAIEPDLILLDMRMPDINGLELLPKLRDRHPRSKIIVTSSYDTSFQKDLISGADGYFDKADGCRALSKAIRAFL